MRSNQILLDVLANNLANVNTVAYKRDGVAFADMLERTMTVPGRPVDRIVGTLGSGAAIGAKVTFAELGPIIPTGNPLDVALSRPNQFLSVETQQGVRYTRDGSLKVNTDGYLTNRDGFFVLDAAGNSIYIGTSGETAETTIRTDGAVMIADVETALLDVSEGNLEKVGANLWAGVTTPVADSQLITGALEGSNANAIDTMVQIISLMRNFESTQKAIQTQDEMTGRLLDSLANR